MTIYTDKIIVSFSNNFDGFNHNFLEVRVCPVCKVCKDRKFYKFAETQRIQYHM